MKQYPDLRPRALSGTRSGVSTNTLSPPIRRFTVHGPLPPPRAGGLSSQGHATRRAERHAPSPSPRLPTPAGSLRSCRVVAGRVVVRGLRRGDPGPEHGVGERRAHARLPAAAGPPLVRGAPSPPAVTACAPAAVLGDVPREGAAAAGLPRLPRRGVRRAGRRNEGGETGSPAPEAPGGAGHRPGDRRLDRPLRRRASLSSSWTPTPGASSRASASWGAARLTRRAPHGPEAASAALLRWTASRAMRCSTTTTTPSSCAWARRPAAPGRAAQSARSTTSARNAGYDEKPC